MRTVGSLPYPAPPAQPAAPARAGAHKGHLSAQLFWWRNWKPDVDIGFGIHIYIHKHHAEGSLNYLPHCVN